METARHNTAQPVDFDGLLRANMAQVFNERDPVKRLAALDCGFNRLWTDQPVLYEHEAAISGAEAISANLSALHQRLPDGTVFTPVGRATVHHGCALLKWSASAPGRSVHTTGTDVAFVRDGRIHRLHVFLDSPRS